MAALLASAPVLACDDVRMTGGDDGYAAAQPDKTAVAQKPLMVTSEKQRPAAKQKTAGKPLPQGVNVTRISN
jgi:hypothetical protein